MSRLPSAASSVEVLGILRDLHPSSAPPAVLDPAQEPRPLRLQRSHFNRCVRSYKPGRASGADGARFEHLANAVTHGDGDALFRFIARIAEGRLGVQAASLLALCRLVALLKESSSSPIRPIGIGCCYRRTAGRIMARQERSALASAFHRPGATNFAVALPGGAEAMVLLVRSRLAADLSSVVSTSV